MPSQMINNESQNHCKKVIGIIHTGSIGIADTLLTKLRATGEQRHNAYFFFDELEEPDFDLADLEGVGWLRGFS